MSQAGNDRLRQKLDEFLSGVDQIVEGSLKPWIKAKEPEENKAAYESFSPSEIVSQVELRLRALSRWFADAHNGMIGKYAEERSIDPAEWELDDANWLMSTVNAQVRDLSSSLRKLQDAMGEMVAYEDEHGGFWGGLKDVLAGMGGDDSADQEAKRIDSAHRTAWTTLFEDSVSQFKRQCSYAVNDKADYSRKCLKEIDRAAAIAKRTAAAPPEKQRRLPAGAAKGDTGTGGTILGIVFLLVVLVGIAWGGYAIWAHFWGKAKVAESPDSTLAVVTSCVLRSGPGSQFEQVEKVEVPTAVHVLDRVPGFCKVSTAGGKTGWVEESAVTVSKH